MRSLSSSESVSRSPVGRLLLLVGVSAAPDVGSGVSCCVGGSGVSSVGSAEGRLKALRDLITLQLLRAAIVNIALEPGVPFPAAPASNQL